MKNKEKLIEYWVKSSTMDFEAALDLFKAKKFPHCLFFAHLSVEKLLKALYVKTNEEHSPITHNLLVLAKGIGLALSNLQIEQLVEITRLTLKPDILMRNSNFIRNVRSNSRISTSR